MKKYQTLQKLSDERLVCAYKEMNLGKLPPGNESIVRTLQGELTKEENKVVPLINVKYHIAMEMVARFC